MKANHDSTPTPCLVSTLGLWIKIGCISFGGPAGQIALLHRELVEKRHWISEQRFLHALNYCMILPGPEAQQLATYLGWLLHRTLGGFLAGLFFVLPSLFLLIGLGWIYLQYGSIPSVTAVFYGIKPAVSAIVIMAAYRIGRRSLNHPLLWLVTLASFSVIHYLDTPFPVILISAAILGALLGARLEPRAKQATPDQASLIGDDTMALPHTHFKLTRCLTVLWVGLMLWCIPMGWLYLEYGWSVPLTQMGWFFTKASLLTFGGAYAVLPYVYQGVVEHYGWLTPDQMMDALALGETTPGPLIMVNTFTGFITGWTQDVLGNSSPFLGGTVAALVVTYFTFLPSFVFILAGGPWVESSRATLRLKGPLTAISAAVVGVILNLALFFAGKVLFPAGLSMAPDFKAILILLFAWIALTRLRFGIISVIFLSGASGYLMTLLPSLLHRG